MKASTRSGRWLFTLWCFGAVITGCSFKYSRVAEYGSLSMGEAYLAPWRALALREGELELARQVEALGERRSGQYPSRELVRCLGRRVASIEAKVLLAASERSQRHHHIRTWMESATECSQACSRLLESEPTADRQAAMGWRSQCDADFLTGATLELEAPRAVLVRAKSAFETGKYGEALSLWSNAQGWLNNLRAGESKRQLRAELETVREANRVVFDREASMLRDPEMNRLMNEASRLRGQLAELLRDRSASATLLRNKLNTELADVVARQTALQEAILRADTVSATPP
jgi:hypothetical protein